MEIEQLKSFVQVAKERNFSKAAENMHITQSTMSTRIKNLEKILGVQLFIRSGKEVELTRLGELYLPYAEQCLEVLTQASKVLGENQQVRKDLRIGVIGPFSNYVLPSFLPSIYSTFSDMNIQVNSFTHAEEVLKMLRASQLDIGFVNTAEPLDHIAEDNLKYVTLYEFQLVLVANPSHPLALLAQNPLNQELAHQKFVFLSPQTSVFKLAYNYLEKHKLLPVPSLEINSVAAVLEIVKAEPFLSFLPKFIVQKELNAGHLIRLELDPPLPSLITSLVYTDETQNRVCDDISTIVIEAAEKLGFQKIKKEPLRYR